MTQAYARKLGLRTQKTDVSAPKIDGSLFETYKMIIVAFQVKNKLGRAWFFQETFILAESSMEVVLGMPFHSLTNAYIHFAKKEPTWRTYTNEDALLTCNAEVTGPTIM